MVQMKKRTKSETRRRRSHHALKAKVLVKCPQCGQLILPHTACSFCGTYKGKPVGQVKSAKVKRATKKVPKEATAKAKTETKDKSQNKKK
ncbi:MAG: 50S ribosomal protein L32 [Parcubacteria group bacterium ADurb.Bin016]|jgi:large subunit ribosomal protein L32|nr:MAG: 50S ribosomal protein L32 [Parcubacteria group bacterium ADurb.Bin016]